MNLKKNLIIGFSFILAPQTPSNWKLGRQLGQGRNPLVENAFDKCDIFVQERSEKFICVMMSIRGVN